jgi:hypothetical protein
MAEQALPICRACKNQALDTRVERARGLCDPCAERTGLWLEPPSIRPTRPCQRCGNTRFVASQLRERSRDAATVLPFGIALAHTESGFITSEAAHPWAPMGIIIAFACRACGLTELYTLEADKIPIGPEHGTHLVDYTPIDGPMR